MRKPSSPRRPKLRGNLLRLNLRRLNLRRPKLPLNRRRLSPNLRRLPNRRRPSGAAGGASARAERAAAKGGARLTRADNAGGARQARRHAFSRRAPSAIAAVDPAKLNRTKPPPRSGSKSTPGVAATPASASIRAQKSTLSPVSADTSA